MQKKTIAILGILIGIALGYGINNIDESSGKLTIIPSKSNQQESSLYLYQNQESSAVASRVVSEVPSEVTSIVLSEDECGASEVTSEVVSFHASPVISFVPTQDRKNTKTKQKKTRQKRKLQKVTPLLIKQLEAIERIQNPEKYKISKKERAQLLKMYKPKN